MNSRTLSLNGDEIKKVKGSGFLLNRGTRTFSARVITENGLIREEQMKVLCDAASKFGNGNILLTVRQSFEIQGIDFDDIPAFIEFIGKAGLKTGGTGAKIRPVVACKGTTCNHGLCDAHSIAKEIHNRFYEGYRGVALPHKFKIAVGGCPNNCVKPDLNDIGIIGQREPIFDKESCRGCTKCAIVEVCPMKAAEIKNGKININKEVCINCGTCVGKCPFKAVEKGEDFFKIYVGGKWGKKVRIGTALKTRFNKEEALDLIEKAILLFKKEGIPGERFGDTIERLGVEKVENMLSNNALIEAKDIILGIML